MIRCIALITCLLFSGLSQPALAQEEQADQVAKQKEIQDLLKQFDASSLKEMANLLKQNQSLTPDQRAKLPFSLTLQKPDEQLLKTLPIIGDPILPTLPGEPTLPGQGGASLPQQPDCDLPPWCKFIKDNPLCKCKEDEESFRIVPSGEGKP